MTTTYLFIHVCIIIQLNLYNVDKKGETKGIVQYVKHLHTQYTGCIPVLTQLSFFSMYVSFVNSSSSESEVEYVAGVVV